LGSNRGGIVLKKIAKDINLIDILCNKEKFISENDIFDKKEYATYNSGELLAYSEMKKDILILDIEKFVDKYLKILEELNQKIDKEKNKENIEKLSGYNNAIISILELINPRYKYYLS